MADAGKRRYDFGGEIVPYKRPKNEVAIRKMHPQAMALSVSPFWVIVNAVFYCITSSSFRANVFHLSHHEWLRSGAWNQ